MEKAFSLLQDFLEKIPYAVGIQRLYANYLAEAGHIEEAITAAQTALRICHQPFSHCNFREHALCHRVLGELFSTSGHIDQAVHHLSEAVQLNPDDAESYFLLGEVYSARGDYNRSLGNYLQAIQIDPNNAKACFKAGLLYKDAKDYPNAEQMFRQAAKIEPNNLTIQRQLGAVVALNLLHHRKTSEKK
jgi:tetratricopeptide (TPR) repeat protein